MIYYFLIISIQDLDSKTVSDEIIIEKIEGLLALQNTKVLWFIKNSKAGQDGMSMLHFAAKFYRHNICQVLIDGIQVDPNIHSKSLRTPLISLIRSDAYKISSSMEKKLTKCFETLISEGANCNVRDDSQMTPLHFAVIGHNYKAIELLVALKELEVSISRHIKTKSIFFDTRSKNPISLTSLGKC